MESLQQMIFRLARCLHRKNEARLQEVGFTDKQKAELRTMARENLIEFVETNLELGRAEAQRIVDTEILVTTH